MFTATNMASARRFVLEHNQEAYLRSLDELLTSDCLVHEFLPGLPNPMNREGYNQFLAAFRSALPDIGNTIEDVIADGDKIAVRWSGSGTHTGGDLMGIPAGGQPVVAHGIYFLRFADGKIAEVWNHWDNLNVVQQLEGRAE
jgi:steroid delta-isomerase-like uncharacterized protein